jgi:flagellin-like hook-associated protein FlgL
VSGITLTYAARSNLLALQNTAELMARTQNNLATGRRVSTALDNPVNFFTASTLGSRSTQLSSLIDGISNGVQTLQAATTGIAGIQRLIKLGESLVDRAARAGNAVATPARVASLGTTYASTDIVGAQNASAPIPGDGPADFSQLHGDYFSTSFDFSTINRNNGATLVISRPGMSPRTYTFNAPGPNAPASGQFSSLPELQSLISADLPDVTFTPSSPPASTFAMVSRVSDAPITVSGTAVSPATFGPDPIPAVAADTFTYSANASPPVTLTYHAPANAATDPANRYFSDPNSFAQAINAIGGASALSAAIDPSGTFVRLTAADKDDFFTLSGSGVSNLGYTPQTYYPAPSLDDTAVTYTIGKGVEQKSVTVRYGYDPTETTTLKQLNDQLAQADMVAVLDPDPSGKVVVKPIAGREADTITLSTPPTWAPTPPRTSTGVAILTGSASGSYTADAVLQEPGASARRQLAKDYTALLDQISGLARDSGYNGQNLLMGETMTLKLNETDSSRYDVQGSRMDADGLGLQTARDGDFLDPQSLAAAGQQLAQASNILQAKGQDFATSYSLADVRQHFTQAMTNVLQTGADNLTLADMNAEAARATALDVRRQIGVSALSASSQAQQSILQLLR